MKHDTQSDVIRQNDWTDQELKALGFQKFERKKQVVLARVLPAAEAPKYIYTTDGGTLVAHTGYMICYMAGDEVRASLDDYPHWPVEPQIFSETYKPWDEAWIPSSPESHLIQLGCQPYYKAAHVWAKELDADTYIQSIEHEKPTLVQTGKILAIGVEGEPYSMGNKTFSERYTPAKRGVQRVVEKLVRFFKR